MKRFGTIATLLAVIAIIRPASASVLCIAPGGHVAIEDADAGCCASPGLHSPVKSRIADETGPEGCGCCTDFVISPNGKAAVAPSGSYFAAPACLPGTSPGEDDTVAAVVRSMVSLGGLIPVSPPSAPLRC
jgi:hypothetical protein